MSSVKTFLQTMFTDIKIEEIMPRKHRTYEKLGILQNYMQELKSEVARLKKHEQK